MADNTQLNSPDIPGGDIISTDDIGGGVKVQRVKMQFGVDGTATDVSASDPLPIEGDVVVSGTVTANTGLSQPLTDAQLREIPVPVSGTVGAIISGEVEVVNDSGNPIPISGTVTANTGLSQPLTDTQLRASPVPVNGTVAITNANLDVALSTRTKPSDQQHTIVDSGTITAVTAISNALPAGNNNIGDVDIASIAAGDNNIGNVDVVTLPALATGVNYIGYVNPNITSSPVSITVSGNGNSFAISGMQFVGLIITGTAVSFSFKGQVSMDGGTTWDDTYLTTPTGTNSFNTTINDQYQILVAGGTTHVRVVLNSIVSGTFTYQYTANMAGSPINLSVSTPGFNVPPSATMVGGIDSNSKLQTLVTTTDGILKVDGSAGDFATQTTLALLYAALALTQGSDATSTKGPMIQALVSDVPNSYVAGVVQPVSLTSEGRLRVSAVNSDINKIWNNIFNSPFFDEDVYPTKNNYFNT